MEEKYNDPTQLRPEGRRLIDGPSVTIDLSAFSAQLKSEITWQNSDRNAITVFKNEDMRMVVVALHMNAIMEEHATENTISVQVLEGKINFKTLQESKVLEAGHIIALQPGMPHSVEAIDESIFLLTLSTPSKL